MSALNQDEFEKNFLTKRIQSRGTPPRLFCVVGEWSVGRLCELSGGRSLTCIMSDKMCDKSAIMCPTRKVDA